MADDDRTIGEVLGEHLRARSLPADSGVSLRWVKVRFLGVPIVFPNFDARRAILVLHDVHHLLTGYDTDWRGEGEIGAFEIATGCKRYWAAWFFNSGGLLIGLLLAPWRTWRAWVRGRRAANYYGRDSRAVLLLPVGAARRELGLDRPVPGGTAADALGFLAWAVLVVVAHVAVPIGATALLLRWWTSA